MNFDDASVIQVLKDGDLIVNGLLVLGILLQVLVPKELHGHLFVRFLYGLAEVDSGSLAVS